MKSDAYRTVKPYEDRMIDAAKSCGYRDGVEMYHNLRRWGWTNERIAVLCNVTGAFLSRWIVGPKHEPSPTQLRAMAHHLSKVKI